VGARLRGPGAAGVYARPRCARTEFHPNDGVTALLDVVQPLNVSEWQRTVHVTVPKSRRCRVTNSEDRYWLLKEVRQCVERQRLAPATDSHHDPHKS